jgi:hypothetical protein
LGAAPELLLAAGFLVIVSVVVMLNQHVRHAPPIEKL